MLVLYVKVAKLLTNLYLSGLLNWAKIAKFTDYLLPIFH